MALECRVVVLVSDVPQFYVCVITATCHSVVILGEDAEAVDRSGMAFEEVGLFAFLNVPDVNDSSV